MTKLQKLLELYSIQLQEIMTSDEEYTKFIRFAAPLYKYPFSEVLLIYAQRPTATLCGEFEFWTSKMGLSLKGAKGIPIVRSFFGENRVVYLFDVCDVTAPGGKKLPSGWSAADLPSEELQKMLEAQQPMVYHHITEQLSTYLEASKGNERIQSMAHGQMQTAMVQSSELIIRQRLGLDTSALHLLSLLVDDQAAFVMAQNIVFYTAKLELSSLQHQISEWRKNSHDNDQKTGIDRPIGNTSGGHHERTVLAHKQSGEIRHTVVEVYGDGASASGDGTATDGQPVQHSAGEGVDGQGVNAGYPDAAQGRPDDGSSRDYHAHPARERAAAASRGAGESGTATLQLTLFSSQGVPLDDEVQIPEDNISEAPLPVATIKAMTNADHAVMAVENFHIPVAESLAPGGAKQKYKKNIAAIECMKSIRQQGRTATHEEQKILCQYSGWGGIPQAFDEQNETWVQEYRQLAKLLSKGEYNKARASTLNAHYTSPEVIRAMYGVLEQLGFKQGRILEPALGAGYFFGLLPQTLSESQLTGVELDNITGCIAQLLYPNADIQLKGFQEMQSPDDFFDVAIGNVPFGDYNITDERYSAHIHDYFFLRTLDKLRVGGILAFITSKGTLDKKNPEIRKMIAQRADLLGAIRLPNTAFKAVAGTEVTSDIVFLQKRAAPPAKEPSWLYLDYYDENHQIAVNRYFVEHPSMMLGTMVRESSLYGKSETALLPADNWQKQLHAATRSIVGHYAPKSEAHIAKIETSLPIDGRFKRFCYGVIDGRLYYNDGTMLRLQQFDRRKSGRVKDLTIIRDTVRQMISMQLQASFDPTVLAVAQTTLTRQYDDFVREYGYINDRANQLAFQDDMDVALLSSLEYSDSNGRYQKSPFFSETTIHRRKEITKADNSLDALLISLNEKGRIDMDYMEALTGLTCEKILSDLPDRVFVNHQSMGQPQYVVSEEYLSGDVRTKLDEVRVLALERPELQHNLEALEKVQPTWISAPDIGVRLSSHWVGEDVISQFIHELLDTPFHLTTASSPLRITAQYNSFVREWSISNIRQHRSLKVTRTFGTSRIGAYDIIESTLNQREITIRDPKEVDGKTHYEYNHVETVAARQKQEVIEQRFGDWIFMNPERRTRLEHKYNLTFNRLRPREYDGNYITLPETNPLITLRPHQKNGIARIRSGGNVLLGHVVGAGKTYTMIAGGMELLRLGTARKLLYVVPNHIIGDFAADFLKLYPAARVLVPSERDFEKANRHRFVAKIATADIHAVIIGHSQFEKLDISLERKKLEFEREIEALEHSVDWMESTGAPRYTVKRLEKVKVALTDKISNLLSSHDKDAMLCFEELRVDRLFIDEADNYKNGAIYSKMTNIAGVPSTSSQKAANLLAKARYIAESGGSVVFATGTFISNSIAEMYVMQRYLQEGALHGREIYHFDEWASDFGETITSIELRPEGGGYRTNTRFSQFFNLPELMSMFKEVADIQTAGMLNLPRPKLVGDKVHIVDGEPSAALLAFMDGCVIRAQRIRNGAVQSTVDNMLKLTSEARKAGTDMRLLDAEATFDPNGKIGKCAGNILKHYCETNSFHGTQLVFSDIGTPAAVKFNVYDELRRQLVELGIPESEVAFIHEAKTDKQKQSLFKDMRSGKMRILIGSTAKCGAGTNIQERLVALHHLDCPWRPRDIEQREGRILRQGNQNPEVHVYRYVTKRSFDSYLWQLLEQKQRFISQVSSAHATIRSCKDIDDTVLSFAEVKAIATGDPRIKESMELQMEVEKLAILKNQFNRERFELQDMVNSLYPKKRTGLLVEIEGISTDIIALKQHGTDFKIKVGNREYSERAKAAEALQDKMLACQPEYKKDALLGNFKGLNVFYCAGIGGNSLCLVGAHRYYLDSGESGLGNIRRIENKVESLEAILQSRHAEVEQLDKDSANAGQQLQGAFPRAEKLLEKQQRLISLTAEINIAAGAVAETTADCPVALAMEPEVCL